MRALLAVVVAALVALASASAGLRGATQAATQDQLAAAWERTTQPCTIKGQMCLTPAGFMGLCTNSPVRIGQLQCSTVGSTKDYTAFTNSHARATPNPASRTNSAGSRGSAHNTK